MFINHGRQTGRSGFKASDCVRENTRKASRELKAERTR
jgi:hypothetical protein